MNCNELTKELAKVPRLLIEAKLQPLQGKRFQPTGFPDLGAATYQLPDQPIEMLVLESPQSVANRLESMIWDEATQTVIAPLQGIPYVGVQTQDGKELTNSLLEAHRLNSFYILEGKDRSFLERLKTELDAPTNEAVDLGKLAKVLAKYDLNSLLHGVFLAKKELAGGRFKLARALSGFIEAYNVKTVSFGGVKNDRVNPSANAKQGGGNIPYHREEFTAESITAYFSLDLAQIRGYRLGSAVENLLLAIALYKVLRFLEQGLRLRSNCELDCIAAPQVKRPDGWQLPTVTELEQSFPALVQAAASAFASPALTIVQYEPEAAEATEKGSKRGRKK